MASHRLRVAVVGAGGIGRLHAQAYHEHPRVALVAVCDHKMASAAALAARYGAQPFTEVSAMLNAGLHLDAASVATAGTENGGDHYAPTMALLDAGIAVLGEKPIANQLPEAAAMVRRARQNHIPYAINFNHRFTPAVIRAKNHLDAGRMGTVEMISLRLWIHNPNETAPWFHVRALHPHSLDLLHHFGGDVARVVAFMRQGEGRSTWSNVQLLLQFRSGATGQLMGSYDAADSYGLVCLDILGSKGRIVVDNGYQRLRWYSRDTSEIQCDPNVGGMRSFEQSFRYRIDAWVAELLAGVSPEAITGSAVEAFRAQEVIEAAIRSWKSQAVEPVAYTPWD